MLTHIVQIKNHFIFAYNLILELMHNLDKLHKEIFVKLTLMLKVTFYCDLIGLKAIKPGLLNAMSFSGIIVLQLEESIIPSALV